MILRHTICDSLRIGFCDISKKNLFPFLINIKTVLTFQSRIRIGTESLTLTIHHTAHIIYHLHIIFVVGSLYGWNHFNCFFLFLSHSIFRSLELINIDHSTADWINCVQCNFTSWNEFIKLKSIYEKFPWSRILDIQHSSLDHKTM